MSKGQEDAPLMFAGEEPKLNIISELKNYRFIFKVVRLYKYDTQDTSKSFSIVRKFQQAYRILKDYLRKQGLTPCVVEHIYSNLYVMNEAEEVYIFFQMTVRSSGGRQWSEGGPVLSLNDLVKKERTLVENFNQEQLDRSSSADSERRQAEKVEINMEDLD